MKLILCYLGLLLLPVTAIAEDICTTIATNSEVEAHFAETRIKEIKMENQRYYVDTSKNGGTCVNDAVWLELEGNSAQEYSYECDQNGCGFGSSASIVSWNDDLYILNERDDFGDFEKLNGWDKLSSTERAKIKFRNLTVDIYKIMPNYRAVSLCEKHELFRRSVQVKILNGDRECLLLTNSQAKSIFPVSLRDKQYLKKVNLIYPKNFSYTGLRLRIDEYSIDLSQKIELDLNRDGKKEIIVPVVGSSGAGCGCGIESVILLDEKDEPLVPQDDFSNNFISFAQSLNCGEKLDVLADGDSLYFEKKTSVGTRQLSLVENANTPVCSYVNDAPLARRG